MKISKHGFTYRQNIEATDFELFHYQDSEPREVEMHTHDFYEIYLFLSGNVSYIIEGKTYNLKPKDILIITNKELHKAFIKKGAIYERIVIWITPDYIKSLNTDKTDLLHVFNSSSYNRYNLLRTRPDIMQYIYDIVEKLGMSCNSQAFGSDVLRKVYITELLVFLNRAYQVSTGKDMELDVTHNDKITAIIQYINENLDGDTSLKILSSIFYLSKYHLLREFKKNTGYTIHKYILHKKLMLARELLHDSVQITEICSKCGFGDYSNFIRTFRKEFGVSPKKYCKRN